MKKFYDKYKLIINAVILALLPMLVCLINMIINGGSFARLWLGQSQWNDELFYYKQVECMVRDTIPAGYFGYNESLAQVYSFGAWSPVILVPWAVWGKIFGWTYISPFISNIVFLSIAMLLFGLLAKPSLEQTAWISGLFVVITPISRYLLSQMPEIVCLSILTIVMGLLIGYRKSGYKRTRNFFIYLLLALLTLMRPYFFVFFLFPIIIANRKKLLGNLVPIAIMVSSVIGYFIISSKMNAPYFTDVYRTDWVDAFKSEGFGGGFIYLIKQLVHYLYEIIIACIGGVRGGYPIGIYFAAFLFVTAEFTLISIYLVKKKARKCVLAIAMLICQVAMLGAICLMYSLQDGFRHLLVFVVAGELLSVFMLKRKTYRRILMGINVVVMLWLFVVQAKDPLYFKTVYNNPSEPSNKTEIIELRKDLEGKMEATSELSWDNDVAVVFTDSKDGGESELIRWQYAYALPEGFAVSLCEASYMKDNLKSLKSKYVLTMTDAQIAGLLEEKGAGLISSNGLVSLYKLR